MVVAERLNFRPGVIALMIPERRDVSFVEVPGDVVEKRGGASASAWGKDDLHEGTPEGPSGPFWIEYIMALGAMQGGALRLQGLALCANRPITFLTTPTNLGWAKHYNHGSMGHTPGSSSRPVKRWIVAAHWTRTKAEH